MTKGVKEFIKTHEKKLKNLTKNSVLPFTSDEVVTNLSSVALPHFNRDTFEYASLERDESKPGIETLSPFLKNITEERDLENFQDFIVSVDAYLLQKVISISLSPRFGDDRWCNRPCHGFRCHPDE